MAAVRAAAAKTERNARHEPQPRGDPRGAGARASRGAPPGGCAARPPPPARERAARRTHHPPPQPPRPPPPAPAPARRSPGRPRAAWQVRARSRRVRSRSPPRQAGGTGRRTPAGHLPSSLSSTIISGAPCPAAARLGREKGTDSGRASAGRPILGQRAGSNYPLVRLLT